MHHLMEMVRLLISRKIVDVFSHMVAVKYKRKLLFIPFVLVTLYLLSTDENSFTSNEERIQLPPEGWMQLPLDITNSSIFSNTFLNVNGGRCILRDSTKRQPKSIDLRIIIISYDRSYSLMRLLKSLDRADYVGDRVVVDIWIDRSKLQLVHNKTLQSALNFTFSNGKCNVYVHQEHVGITGQWLSTWSPTTTSSEIAAILEDDLTVSPFFYIYLKLVHQKYGNRKDVYGFSLQGSATRHSDGKCRLDVSLQQQVYLYPTLGTSGFSPNTRNWLQFLSWLEEIKRKKIDVIPFIKNHIAVKWYRELKRNGRADTMWEMEYLFYTQHQKEYALYPNFPGNQGLTFNWFEDGLHFTGRNVKDKDVERKNLVMKWTLDYDTLPDNPIYLNNNGDVLGY